MAAYTSSAVVEFSITERNEIKMVFKMKPDIEIISDLSVENAKYIANKLLEMVEKVEKLT